MLGRDRLPSDRQIGPALLSLGCLAIGILVALDAASSGAAHDEVRRVDAWSEQGSFTLRPLAPDGAPLAADAPGYFDMDAPRVGVGFSWRLVDPQAERVAALGELKLRVESEPTPGRAGWTHEETLAEGKLAGTALEALALAGELDLAEAARRIEATPGREAAGASWTIVANVRFESAPHEDRRADASAFEAPLRYTPPLYVLPEEAPIVKDHARNEVVHHAARPLVDTLAQRPLHLATLAVGILGTLTYARALVQERRA